MAIRNEDTGTEEILRDARYHLAAVEADPRTGELAAAVRNGMATLRTARNAAEDKEEVRVGGLARLLRADFELDEILRMVELGLLGLVAKDRKDPRYRALLPNGLSALIALRGREEGMQVQAMLPLLQQHAPDLATRYSTDLERLAGAVIEAEIAWRQAEIDATMASGAARLARADLVQQLYKNEGALGVIFPGQRRRIRSFFRPTRRRGAAPTEGAPEDSGGAEEAGNA